MRSQYLRPRDIELLRTLLRVQFASTGSLQRVFFSSNRAARKRLSDLRDRYGVIAAHEKGLPTSRAGAGGQFWYITRSGISLVVEAHPTTHVPDNHIVRCQSASLRYFEHRVACAELYLRLIECKSRDVALITERANEIRWFAEHDVDLPYMSVSGARFVPRKVIPDATLATPFARIFLELDRSTETHTHVRGALNNYRSALDDPNFGTAVEAPLPTVVIYVTKSEARARNLGSLIESMGTLPFQAHAFAEPVACDWLSRAVTAPPGPAPMPPPYDECKSHLRVLYEECCAELKEHGAVPKNDNLRPALEAVFDFFERTKAPAQ